jgi:hypothetical protein
VIAPEALFFGARIIARAGPRRQDEVVARRTRCTIAGSAHIGNARAASCLGALSAHLTSSLSVTNRGTGKPMASIDNALSISCLALRAPITERSVGRW